MRLRVTYNSPVVLTFSLLSLAALLLSMATGGYIITYFFTLYRTSFTDPLQYLRLFTHTLGHASIEHFSGNITLLLLIGPMLEEKYGSRRLLAVMVFTGLVTGVVHLLLFPGVAVLGASGVVFAFILLASFTDCTGHEIPLTLIVVALVYLGGEVLSGVFETDAVSQFSHIVGGVIGAIFGFVYAPRTKAEPPPLP